jgi:hypothetical protein
MKITVKTSDLGNMPSPGGGYVMSGSDVDHLVGRVLTLIETLGLNESQEKAIKDLARQELWAPFNSNVRVYVDDDLLSMIEELYRKMRDHHKGSQSNGSPVPPGKIEYELTVRTE